MADYLRPANATQSAELSAEQKDSIFIRDALWTLVEDGYDGLWRAGAWLFGRGVDEHVPPLLSREIARKK